MINSQKRALVWLLALVTVVFVASTTNCDRQTSSDGDGDSDSDSDADGDTCTPNCVGRCCGDDGCGGECSNLCSETGQTCNTESCECEGDCIPRTCEDQGRVCGTWPDGCNTDINCGECSTGSVCNDSGQCDLICSGRSLTANGVLDLNIDVIQVNGAVRLNDADLPDHDMDRGQIVFVSLEMNGSLVVPLESTGSFTYSVTLSPGTYRIEYQPNLPLCHAEPPGQMPCNWGVLVSEVEFRSDGVYDINIPTVRVQGAVTVNEQTMPDETVDRGSLMFTQQGGGFALTEVFETNGAVDYSLTLLPGIYDISLSANPALCFQDQTAQVPCISGPLLRDTNLSSDGVLDINIPAVHIQGDVTVNDNPVADETMDRGSLLFSLQDGGQTTTEPFETNGSVSYELTLLSGLYNISFDGNEALCTQDEPPEIPCINGLLQSAVNLSADGVLDVNIPAIQVQGDVTVNEATMPNETMDRGSLLFVFRGGGQVTSEPFETTGPASYELTLIPGVYDIQLEANEGLCFQDENPEVPCINGTLVPDTNLTSSGVLNVNIPAVQIQGDVMVNSGVMLNETMDRGSLLFMLEGGGQATTEPFETNGPVVYELTLLPGMYDIHLTANPALCLQEELSQVPCLSGPVEDDVNLSSDGVLNVDIPAIQVQGQVTLEEAVIPDSTMDRGSLLFVMLDGGQGIVSAFETNGAVSYSATIIPGNYLGLYQTNPSLCTEDTLPDLPCTNQVLMGCSE